MFGSTFRSSGRGPHNVCSLCLRKAFRPSDPIVRKALRYQSTSTAITQEHETSNNDKLPIPTLHNASRTNEIGLQEKVEPETTSLHHSKVEGTEEGLNDTIPNITQQASKDVKKITKKSKPTTSSKHAQSKSPRSRLTSAKSSKTSNSEAHNPAQTSKTKLPSSKKPVKHGHAVRRVKGGRTNGELAPIRSVKEDLVYRLREISKAQGKLMSKRTLMELLENGSLTDAGRKDAMRKLRASLVSKGVLDVEAVIETAALRGPILGMPNPNNESSSIKEAMQRTSTRGPRGSKDRDADQPARRIEPIKQKHEFKDYEMKSVSAGDLKLTPHEVSQPPVPTLAYGLERALFNPGVYHLRDPRSRVFNFDPYLQTIMPVAEFDFNALKEYITSSRDETLMGTAAKLKKKYTGSTSSMTSALSHFHYILSHWREINTSNLSKGFPDDLLTFTNLQRSPAAIFLRWKDGTYAIDADKQYDTPNILSMLGKSMEKLLTLPPEDYERYRKENSHQISEEERDEAEAFHYTTMGDFLMRSQLDAHDPRLPGTGMFDLKTRAVVSIRMDARNYEQGLGYEILGRHGEYHSYEREYYDMIRSAFLKYSLQVRMGRMDGIFVAFHNTERIFGFQYISLNEMDLALHGTEDTTTGDMEFKISLELLNRVLDRATAKYPKQSLRIHFEARESTGKNSSPFLYIFATPVSEKEIHNVQNTNKDEVKAFERRVLGLHGGTSEEEMKLDEAEAKKEEEKASWEALQAQVEEEIDNDEGEASVQEEEYPVTEQISGRGKSTVGEEEKESELATSKDSKSAGASTKESLPVAGKDLLAMYLTVRNKINGKYVERPEKLTADDKWEVEYALAEIPNPKGTTLYKSTLSRRKNALISNAASGLNDFRKVYLEKISRLVDESKEFREKQDKLDQTEPLKVFSPAADSTAKKERADAPQEIH